MVTEIILFLLNYMPKADQYCSHTVHVHTVHVLSLLLQLPTYPFGDGDKWKQLYEEEKARVNDNYVSGIISILLFGVSFITRRA